MYQIKMNIPFIAVSYTHLSDDILVKFMHCEKEVTIPVETDIAPFYHWKDVETYYRHLLHKLP